MAEPGHLLHVFSTFAVGGPEVRTCDIINHFGDAYRHTIIAMDGLYYSQDKLQDGLPVEYAQLQFNKRHTFRNAMLFRKTLRMICPDVLLTYNWATIEWAMANYLSPFCPQIHAEDGFGPEETEKQIWRRVLFRRVFLSKAFRVVVPSMNLFKLARQVWRLPEKTVEHIPNGIDVKAASEGDSLRRDDRIVIGTIAALRGEKNIHRLVRIFSKLPAEERIELWIVGDGPEYESIRNKVWKLGLGERVQMWGYQKNPTGLLQKMDIFAISSDTEQMPISVLEAMACGCSIVSTDVGDVKGMVSEENRAFVIHKEDEEGYRNHLIKLINDRDLRRALGEKNRKRCVEAYRKEDMFAAYKGLYDSAIQMRQMRK